jgi:hypothetical protein
LAASLSPSYGLSDPYWLFAPTFGYYTFISHRNYRSPYGYRYYGVRTRRVVTATYSSSSGVDASQRPPTNTTPGNSNSNSGDGGGGGGAPAPVTVSTPAGERSAPAVYIESKRTPVGATQ